MKKRIDNYMKKPYSLVINQVKDQTGIYFFGKVLEFEGCQSVGNSYIETEDKLKEEMQSWIEKRIQAGVDIPKPFSERKSFK